MQMLADIWLLNLLLATWSYHTLAGSCPTVCICKWKSGKRTVECLDRALIIVPENIDSETQVLDISGNNLQIIPRETFYKANLTNLQKVYLKSCRIGQIGERAFRGLTNLVELDLSHNLLTAVPSATFVDIPFLRYLSLANNPIQKIESSAFAAVTGVAKIDLSHCEIQTISAFAFEKVDCLEWLKLNGNKLSELKPKTIESISKLHGIELHDNPWVCDCNLRAAKEWLALYNIPYTIRPACHGPKRVAGRTFAELSIDDFACRPEVLPISRYIEATTGENATVVCRIGAVPPASIHWYWNGRLLLNNSAFSTYQKVLILEEGIFEKTSSLILTNALETDSSEFYCVAENKAGSAEANFTLHVALRTAGMASLGSGQIVGLSAAVVVLILAILMVALILLLRLRRLPFSESKTPGQLEVIATVKGNGVTTSAKPIVQSSRIIPDSTGHKEDRSMNQHRNHRRSESYSSDRRENVAVDGPPPYQRYLFSPNNPDIIRDTKPTEFSASSDHSILTGDHRRSSAAIRAPETVPDPVRPNGGWENESSSSESFLQLATAIANQGYDASDRTPIISEEELENKMYSGPNFGDYPPDYGLPILKQPTCEPDALVPTLSFSPDNPRLPDAKTLRVWQRGVPVLPPVTALKRVLTNSRNSPDEGYQEGCGTDV